MIETTFEDGTLRGVIDGVVTVTLTRLRDLEDAHILLTGAGGRVTSKLREHFAEHFARGALPSPSCEFCKLQGKILAAEGRRRLREEETRAARITLVPKGVTGEKILAAEARAGKSRETRIVLAKGSENAWF
jgi:hypothetical protein